MTVPSTTRRAGPFTGTGALVAYPFAFKVFAKQDLAVTIADANGLETDLVLDSTFTVTLNVDQEATPGGTVNYAVGGVATALPSGYTLVVTGDGLEFEQTADLPQGGNFSPVVIENALDRIVMLLQRLWDGVRRSMRLPDTASDNVSTVLPVPTANNFIGWDGNGTALRNVDPNTLATVVAFAAWQSQAFSGDGVTTQFTLSSDPGNVNNLDVVVGAVPQRNNVDFTLSGTTLTFDVAPANGLSIFCRWGQALPEGTSTLQTRLVSTASAADNAGLIGWAGGLDYSSQGDDTVGGMLYSVFGRTAGEIAAGVTPVNYAYPPGHVERYAHNTVPGTTDMTAGINAAYASTGGGGGATIYFDAKQYNHTGLTFDGALNLTMVGKTANNIGNSQAGSFAKSTVLFYTGSSGVGVTFTGSTYTSSGLVFKRIVFYAASSAYCITFNNCAQIEFKKCMILNNGSSSTAHGIRLSACYYVWFYDSFIAKGDNVRTGTSTGVTIDMGARSSWLGGALNFINTSTQSWASGMIVGDSNPSSANENYATINYIGGEFLSNQVGVQLQHGVKAANFAGTYFEANLNIGAFVTLGAQGVKFDTCFWNNYSASDADIRFGIGGGNTQYQEFYNCAVKNNTFISVNAKGVVASGVGSSFVDVENNTFTLATVGAVGINSNGTWCRQSDNTFIGFAPGNLATGTFAPSISTTGGSFTATATGFAGSVTGTAYGEKHGNVGHVYMPGLSGTSNATSFTITGLPSDMIPTRTQSAIPVYVVDNSGSPSAVGQVQLNSSGVFTVYPSVAFGNWTASGTKTCGSFNYTYLLT